MTPRGVFVGVAQIEVGIDPDDGEIIVDLRRGAVGAGGEGVFAAEGEEERVAGEDRARGVGDRFDQGGAGGVALSLRAGEGRGIALYFTNKPCVRTHPA